jgi:hypothetical protein
VRQQGVNGCADDVRPIAMNKGNTGRRIPVMATA